MREIARHKYRDCGVNLIKVPGADHPATATASATMSATIAKKTAASKSDMSHIIAP